MDDWTARANCRGMNPELFFESLNNQYKRSRPLPEAVIACQECQVRSECYVYAMHHEEHGYWAGTDPADRRRLRKLAGITVKSPGVPLVLNSRPHAQGEQREEIAVTEEKRKAEEVRC